MSNLDLSNNFKGAIQPSSKDLQTEIKLDSNEVEKPKEYWFNLNELEIKISEEILIKEFCSQGKIIDFYFKKDNPTYPNFYSEARIKLSQLKSSTDEITSDLSRR